MSAVSSIGNITNISYSKDNYQNEKDITAASIPVPGKDGNKNSKINNTSISDSTQKSNAGNNSTNNSGTKKLSEKQQKAVEDLKRIDSQVRAHEAAHEAAGGNLVRGKSFNYVIGPDGKQYATGGEVKIDMSVDKDNPETTVQKMEQVKRAALAPTDPSSQDRSVASLATSIEAQARTEEHSKLRPNLSHAANSPYILTYLKAQSEDLKSGKHIDQINKI
jgi:hypothetical protein